jgi:hypothetical protein
MSRARFHLLIHTDLGSYLAYLNSILILIDSHNRMQSNDVSVELNQFSEFIYILTNYIIIIY